MSDTSNQQIQSTIARIHDLNEGIIKSAESAGAEYLASYEQTLSDVADLQKQLAGAGPLSWITALAGAHAKFVQGITTAFTEAARSTLP